MKLWDKGISTEEQILGFTTGEDPQYDLALAPFDVAGSMAHAIMLAETGLMSKEESATLLSALAGIFEQVQSGTFRLDPGTEDIHSQVEKMLTESLGDLGKKIHTGRSRNDQVMVDIKLYLREALQGLAGTVGGLARTLLFQAEKHKQVLMPGFTHMQVAMPSSFGLWFGGYAESLADDLEFVNGVFRTINQNPLGSAAGFGSSLPIDRDLTTRLLGFPGPHISSVNAQLHRGKTEWYTASALAAVASTLSRLAMDAVLFTGQNFRFLSLPPEFTTGSSIMPHKKNPDVLELIRARCNLLTQLPARVTALTGNLISGYHRDFQELKGVIHPAFPELDSCLEMADRVMGKLEINTAILEDPTYQYLFSVEAVNQRVKEGIPFRDAYREVADEIEKGRYRPGRVPGYTHLGSIGNPGIERIREKLERAVSAFDSPDLGTIVERLIHYYDPT